MYMYRYNLTCLKLHTINKPLIKTVYVHYSYCFLVNDFSDLGKIRRVEHCKYLGSPTEIEVDRDNIVETVLRHYRSSDLEHHKIEVRFKGEIGLDADRITREMLQLFFQELTEKYFRGSIQKVSSNNMYTGFIAGRLACEVCGRWFHTQCAGIPVTTTLEEGHKHECVLCVAAYR
jgi:hypothetical protein